MPPLLALALLAQPADAPPASAPPAVAEAPALDVVVPEVEPEAPRPPVEPAAEATLLLADQVFAESILREGPLAAYRAALSEAGVLFDASGATTPGPLAATERFGEFPADVSLERQPEAVRAEGRVGTTWGSYAIVQGGIPRAIGRYITTWERSEDGSWKILAELAAGRAAPPVAELPPVEPPSATDESVTGASRDAGPSEAAPVEAPPPRVLRDAFGRPVVPLPAQPSEASPAPPAEPDDAEAITNPSSPR